MTTDHRFASVPYRGTHIHNCPDAPDGMVWEAWNLDTGEILCAATYATLQAIVNNPSMLFDPPTIVRVTSDNADTWLMPRTGGRRFLVGQWLTIDATGRVINVSRTRTAALATLTASSN